ncbi:MAG: LruC domain-containing protein [Candidatus Cloacimonetes bacterium]|nr:LruC domain-containing protein [Candidatus Cloacimonadota bacterium]
MRKMILFCLFIAVLAFFTGCSNNTSSDKVTSMHDLEVPEGFNFETTHLLKVMAYGPETRTLFVAQTNGVIVYKGLLDASAGFNETILLPTSICALDFRYNGEVITRNITPTTETVYLNFTATNREVLEDTDGDGVPDDEDDFPLDSLLCYLNEFPPQDTTRCRNYGTIAYEDRWPSEGDYDFNDVILNYYITECTNRWNSVRYIYFYLYYSVDGAGFNNGMYFKLPYDAGGYAYYNYPHSDEQFDAYLEDGNVYVRLFEAAQTYMPDPPTFHNTEEGSGFTQPLYFEIEIDLYDADMPDDPTIECFPPYNPYIVIDQTPGREAHFANYTPSNVVDIAWFNTQDDTSDPGSGRYYVTALDLPWGIHLPTMFDNPLERVSIINAYPQFADWVTSGGMTNTDWYNYPAEGNVYNFIEQASNILD